MNETKSHALKVIQVLQGAGFQAYFVGGCVRDEWLGRSVHDYDIATNAAPEEVMKLFPSAIPTGLKHGTVTVIIEHIPFEVTTFRRDVAYRRHRWPEVVFVGDLTSDLSRRDFTINAMARTAEGAWIDPFGGRNDAQKKLIRAVGRPAERFQEDALRMLRAIRLASELQFEIEKETWNALCQHAHLISQISVERISQELARMVRSPQPEKGLMLLQKSGLKRHILPLRHFSLWNEKMLKPLKEIDNETERWAFLLLLIRAGDAARGEEIPLSNDENVVPYGEQGEKAKYAEKRKEVSTQSGEQDEITARPMQQGEGSTQAQNRKRTPWQVLRELKFPKKEIRCILEMVDTVEDLHAGTPFEQLLLRHDANWMERVILLYILVYQLPSGKKQALLKQMKQTAGRLVITSPKELKISGREILQEVAERPGSWIQKILDRLYEEVALGKIPNEPEALQMCARAFYQDIATNQLYDKNG